MNISVVISTRNRSQSLERTLRSVKSLRAEYIVVDNESDDGTADIAARSGAKVFRRKNSLMLNENKNFGFGKASQDWILCLDDDEELTPELAEEIEQVIRSAGSETAGFWIPRKNLIFGKWIRHGIWWPDPQLRLFRRGSGRYPEKHVHEYIEVTGLTRTLTHAMVHHNYDSVDQYIGKMQNIYTESEVRKYEAAGFAVSWKDAIRFPVSDFLKLYLAQEGYRDGLHGLALAGLQAFYAFIIFLKLWERTSFREQDISLADSTRELRRAGNEYSYWDLTARLKQTHHPVVSLWLRFLRKRTALS